MNLPILRFFRSAGIVLAALLASVLAVSIALAEPLPSGLGRFTLANEGEPIEVFTYKPPTYADGPLIVVIHGSDRDAEDHRNWAIHMAERFDALVVAPEFDRARFSDERYKRTLGVTLQGVPQPREKWTPNVIVRLVAEVRQREGRPGLPYYMIGHSGGGQFVSKMAMFLPDGAKGFVACNPGSYPFPWRDEKFPYGIGGLPDDLAGDEALRRFHAQPLALLIGTGDVWQHAEDGFDTSSGAMRQGPVRLARAQNFFLTSRKIAAERGWPFNWRLVEVPWVGHQARYMFKARELEQAMFPAGQPATNGW